jgi:hypothetical protein
MAVFISASDENTDNQDFAFGGLLAPEQDWSSFFAPAWQEGVLNGPPMIPYLHMTEIRSRSFRERYGLSRLQADDRIDQAVDVIGNMGSMCALVIDVNSAHFRDEMKEVKFIAKSGGVKKYHPDYTCFITYVYAVLLFLDKWRPEVEKVDFVVERNGEMTKHIQTFHENMAENLSKTRKRPDLARLVGKLIPAGKDHIPLQAADVLCWHMGRARKPETMDDDDIRRYNILASLPGTRVPLKKDLISELKEVIKEAEAKKDGA